MNQKIISTDYNTNFSAKRKQLKEKFNFGVNSTFFMLLGVIASLLLYFVWSLNVNATGGYNLKQLEIDKKNLMMDLERLDVKLAELQSLDTIMETDGMKNMEKVKEADFLVIKDNVQYVYNDK